MKDGNTSQTAEFGREEWAKYYKFRYQAGPRTWGMTHVHTVFTNMTEYPCHLYQHHVHSIYTLFQEIKLDKSCIHPPVKNKQTLNLVEE